MKDKIKEIASSLAAGGSVEHAINALLKLAGDDDPEEKKPAAKPAPTPTGAKKK